MKYLLLFSFSMFLVSISYGQNTCSAFYPFTQGTVSEITTYDKRGKVSSVLEYTVLESTGQSATIQNEVTDKDGEQIAESTFDMTCAGDGITIDVKSMFSPQMMAQYENMETSITGNDVILPNSLTVGQELPDAEMHLSVSVSGIAMNIDVNMVDRKVVGEESVTTPAGTFDCMVIEYTSKIKMGLERTGNAKQWISKGVGMVKQEDYNKRGKVMSSSLLTAFEK